MDIPKKELTHVLNWVEERLQGESEAPWTWYQYMKLREVVGAILTGVDPLTPKEGSQQLEPRLGHVLQLVDCMNRKETAQYHPVETLQEHLPK